MSELLNLAANVGFPMVVAAYLLIRIEGQLGQLTRAVQELREAIIAAPRSGALPAILRDESPELIIHS